MESDEDVTGPVNLGNPNEFTIEQLAKKVVGLVGAGHGCLSKIVYKELPMDDPTQRQPNIAQAKEILNWSPKISLDEGLTKTIEYFRSSI